MPNINITVAEKIATNMSPGVNIVCGNSDYNITFSFDSEWAGMEERTARFLFYKQGRSWFTDTKFTGDTVQVPVLAGVEFVLVGAYAGELHTTTPARILCNRSILCDDATEQVDGPTRENLEQLIKEIEQKLASGAFVGPPGPQGADGTVAFEELTDEQRESLRGPQGERGDQGERGEQGPHGEKGADGTVAFEDLTEEQLESLRGPAGPQGPEGPTGPQGPEGPKGADGTMTFEDLTEEQRESLRGPQGEQGPAGYSPVRGKDYWTSADIAEIKSYVDDAILGGAW